MLAVPLQSLALRAQPCFTAHTSASATGSSAWSKCQDTCSFVRGLFMGVTESRGGANTQLKQRDFASIGSFILPGFPF